jgi:hypothetical protein
MSTYNSNQDKMDARALWERPALRRLAANEARGGDNPGNDGKGGGSGSDQQHS